MHPTCRYLNIKHQTLFWFHICCHNNKWMLINMFAILENIIYPLSSKQNVKHCAIGANPKNEWRQASFSQSYSFGLGLREIINRFNLQVKWIGKQEWNDSNWRDGTIDSQVWIPTIWEGDIILLNQILHLQSVASP